MITCHTNSFFNSISYKIGSVLIDPGDKWEGFIDVEKVLLTHAHFDHIYGLNELLKASPNIRIYTNSCGKDMLLNAKKNMSFYHETPFTIEIEKENSIILVDDGEEIQLDNGQVAKAIFTPGHNPSCITWLIDDLLFTGDAYIPDVKIVTNLPGGNKTQSQQSINIIKELAIGREICPGHMVQTLN